MPTTMPYVPLCEAGTTVLVKGGFTGKTEDTLGREHCFADGKQVPCSPGEQTTPEQPAKQPDQPEQKQGAQGKQPNGEPQPEQGLPDPEQLTPEEKQKFAEEWDAALDTALNEPDTDVAQHAFTPEEVAAEQNWHGQYMQWRHGTPGILPPEEAGKAVRFVSGLANSDVGTAAHIEQLAQQAPPAEPGLLAEIVDLVARFFELLPELLDPTAKVLAGTFGEQAKGLVKKASKKPKTLKDKKKQEEAANEGRYTETTKPTEEQRAQAQPVTGPPSKGSKTQIASRREKLKKQAQGKQRAFDALTPEERAEKLARAKEKRARKQKGQEARSAAFWKQREKEGKKSLPGYHTKSLPPTRLRRDDKGLLDSAARYVADKWNALEHRYGRTQALTMLGAMLATAPIPGNIAAVIAAAEALRYFTGTVPVELKDMSWLDTGRGGALVPPARLPVSRLRRKALGKGSYFGECQRDESGRCLPSGEAETPKPQQAVTELAEPDKATRLLHRMAAQRLFENYPHLQVTTTRPQTPEYADPARQQAETAVARIFRSTLGEATAYYLPGQRRASTGFIVANPLTGLGDAGVRLWVADGKVYLGHSLMAEGGKKIAVPDNASEDDLRAVIQKLRGGKLPPSRLKRQPLGKRLPTL